MAPCFAMNLAAKTVAARCRREAGSALNSGGALGPSAPRSTTGNSTDSRRNLTSDMDAESGRGLLPDGRPQPVFRFRRRLAVVEREILRWQIPRVVAEEDDGEDFHEPGGVVETGAAVTGHGAGALRHEG